MKKAFITGITGFAGSFLAEHLIEEDGYEVTGTYLTQESLRNVSHLKDKPSLHKIDLLNSEHTENVIAQISPDLIFHLAALAAPGESFGNPAKFLSNNIEAQVNVLEGVRKAEIMPRILIVSSAEVYGDVSLSDLPIDENTPLAPVNPYAVSKVACDFLGLQYFLSYNFPIVRVRPFNHIGPRQSPSFVVAAFAKKITEIERGKMEPILKVGNLSAKRDLTDVRDTVEGYVRILEQGTPGEVYNIGSGKSYRIEDILSMLLSFSNKKIKVEVDQGLMRPVDVPELVCDNTKVRRATGWQPKIPIEQTLRETLDYWRNQV
ncbi:MAG: GDP-mannose 4,6-dehydratase [Candidatus Levybacteria bacterium]|nr:GDP-mannose 4,6-dehydratase [Candidatus Levybacteria bacterium]